MYRDLLASAGLLLVVSGCSTFHGVKVLDVDNGPKPVYKTTKCTHPNADGQRCDVKTCKADAESNCGSFATACMDTGHHYAGTNDGGTCTRVL
jgi:hypothetical protein